MMGGAFLACRISTTAGWSASKTASFSDRGIVPVGGKKDAAALSDNGRSKGPSGLIMADAGIEYPTLPVRILKLSIES
jgi:hypothetical protein